MTFQQTGALSFDQTIEVANQSLNDSHVLSWQLELKLSPINGAQGQLEFTGIAAPLNPLFGELSEPFAEWTSPTHILAFDFDPLNFENGSLVSGGERRNILSVTIAASADAAGDFELITRAFDPDFPDLGTSWFPANGMEPVGFENSTVSSVPGFILLGVIHIIPPFPPGDYNRDYAVDQLDYQNWREAFATTVSVPGDGADGNHDGVVDAADYVVWRRHYSPALEAQLVNNASVPEPSAIPCLIVHAMLLTFGVRYRYP